MRYYVIYCLFCTVMYTSRGSCEIPNVPASSQNPSSVSSVPPKSPHHRFLLQYRPSEYLNPWSAYQSPHRSLMTPQRRQVNNRSYLRRQNNGDSPYYPPNIRSQGSHPTLMKRWNLFHHATEAPANSSSSPPPSTPTTPEHPQNVTNASSTENYLNTSRSVPLTPANEDYNILNIQSRDVPAWQVPEDSRLQEPLPLYPNYGMSSLDSPDDQQLNLNSDENANFKKLEMPNSLDSPSKFKRGFRLLPVSNNLYVLKQDPVVLGSENTNDNQKTGDLKRSNPQFDDGTADLLAFKAHMHHRVEDIGKTFLNREMKKDVLSSGGESIGDSLDSLDPGVDSSWGPVGDSPALGQFLEDSNAGLQGLNHPVDALQSQDPLLNPLESNPEGLKLYENSYGSVDAPGSYSGVDLYQPHSMLTKNLYQFDPNLQSNFYPPPANQWPQSYLNPAGLNPLEDTNQQNLAEEYNSVMENSPDDLDRGPRGDSEEGHLGYLDNYARAVEAINDNWNLAQEAGDGGGSRPGDIIKETLAPVSEQLVTSEAPKPEENSDKTNGTSLAMVIEPLTAQLQKLLSSIQQVNEKLMSDQDSRETPSAADSLRRKRGIDKVSVPEGEFYDDLDDDLDDEEEIREERSDDDDQDEDMSCPPGSPRNGKRCSLQRPEYVRPAKSDEKFDASADDLQNDSVNTSRPLSPQKNKKESNSSIVSFFQKTFGTEKGQSTQVPSRTTWNSMGLATDPEETTLDTAYREHFVNPGFLNDVGEAVVVQSTMAVTHDNTQPPITLKISLYPNEEQTRQPEVQEKLKSTPEVTNLPTTLPQQSEATKENFQKVPTAQITQGIPGGEKKMAGYLNYESIKSVESPAGVRGQGLIDSTVSPASDLETIKVAIEPLPESPNDNNRISNQLLRTSSKDLLIKLLPPEIIQNITDTGIIVRVPGEGNLKKTWLSTLPTSKSPDDLQGNSLWLFEGQGHINQPQDKKAVESRSNGDVGDKPRGSDAMVAVGDDDEEAGDTKLTIKLRLPARSHPSSHSVQKAQRSIDDKLDQKAGEFSQKTLTKRSEPVENSDEEYEEDYQNLEKRNIDKIGNDYLDDLEEDEAEFEDYDDEEPEEDYKNEVKRSGEVSGVNQSSPASVPKIVLRLRFPESSAAPSAILKRSSSRDKKKKRQQVIKKSPKQNVRIGRSLKWVTDEPEESEGRFARETDLLQLTSAMRPEDEDVSVTEEQIAAIPIEATAYSHLLGMMGTFPDSERQLMSSTEALPTGSFSETSSDENLKGEASTEESTSPITESEMTSLAGTSEAVSTTTEVVGTSTETSLTSETSESSIEASGMTKTSTKTKPKTKSGVNTSSTETGSLSTSTDEETTSESTTDFFFSVSTPESSSTKFSSTSSSFLPGESMENEKLSTDFFVTSKIPKDVMKELELMPTREETFGTDQFPSTSETTVLSTILGTLSDIFSALTTSSLTSTESFLGNSSLEGQGTSEFMLSTSETVESGQSGIESTSETTWEVSETENSEKTSSVKGKTTKKTSDKKTTSFQTSEYSEGASLEKEDVLESSSTSLEAEPTTLQGGKQTKWKKGTSVKSKIKPTAPSAPASKGFSEGSEETSEYSSTETSTEKSISSEKNSESASTSSSSKAKVSRTEKSRKTSEKSKSSSASFSYSTSAVTEEMAETSSSETSREMINFTERSESSTTTSTSEEASETPTGEITSPEEASAPISSFPSTKEKMTKTKKPQNTSGKFKFSSDLYSSSTTEVPLESTEVRSLSSFESKETSEVTEETMGSITTSTSEEMTNVSASSESSSISSSIKGKISKTRKPQKTPSKSTFFPNLFLSSTSEFSSKSTEHGTLSSAGGEETTITTSTSEEVTNFTGSSELSAISSLNENTISSTEESSETATVGVISTEEMTESASTFLSGTAKMTRTKEPPKVSGKSKSSSVSLAEVTKEMTKEVISTEETPKLTSTSSSTKVKFPKTKKPQQSSGKSKSSSFSPLSSTSEFPPEIDLSSSTGGEEISEVTEDTIRTSTSVDVTNFTGSSELSSISSLNENTISSTEESSETATGEVISTEEITQSTSTFLSGKVKMTKTKKPPKGSGKSKSSSVSLTEVTKEMTEGVMSTEETPKSTTTSSSAQVKIPKTKKPKQFSGKSKSSSVSLLSLTSEFPPETGLSPSTGGEETSEVTENTITIPTSEEVTNFPGSSESSSISSLNEQTISTTEESFQPSGKLNSSSVSSLSPTAEVPTGSTKIEVSSSTGGEETSEVTEETTQTNTTETSEKMTNSTESSGSSSTSSVTSEKTTGTEESSETSAVTSEITSTSGMGSDENTTVTKLGERHPKKSTAMKPTEKTKISLAAEETSESSESSSSLTSKTAKKTTKTAGKKSQSTPTIPEEEISTSPFHSSVTPEILSSNEAVSTSEYSSELTSATLSSETEKSTSSTSGLLNDNTSEFISPSEVAVEFGSSEVTSSISEEIATQLNTSGTSISTEVGEEEMSSTEEITTVTKVVKLQPKKFTPSKTTKMSKSAEATEDTAESFNSSSSFSKSHKKTTKLSKKTSKFPETTEETSQPSAWSSSSSKSRTKTPKKPIKTSEEMSESSPSSTSPGEISASSMPSTEEISTTSEELRTIIEFTRTTIFEGTPEFPTESSTIVDRTTSTKATHASSAFPEVTLMSIITPYSTKSTEETEETSSNTSGVGELSLTQSSVTTEKVEIISEPTSELSSTATESEEFETEFFFSETPAEFEVSALTEEDIFEDYEDTSTTHEGKETSKSTSFSPTSEKPSKSFLSSTDSSARAKMTKTKGPQKTSKELANFTRSSKSSSTSLSETTMSITEESTQTFTGGFISSEETYEPAFTFSTAKINISKTTTPAKTSSVLFSSPTSEVFPESTDIWSSSSSETSQVTGEMTETITTETSGEMTNFTGSSELSSTSLSETSMLITEESTQTSTAAKAKISTTTKSPKTSEKSKTSSGLFSSPTSEVPSESTEVWSSSSAETSEVTGETTETITTETSEEITKFTGSSELFSTSVSVTTMLITKESTQTSTERFVSSEETSESASTSQTTKAKMSKTKKPPQTSGKSTPPSVLFSFLTSEVSPESSEVWSSSSAESSEVTEETTEPITSSTSEEMANFTGSSELSSASLSEASMLITEESTQTSTGGSISNEESSELASTSLTAETKMSKTEKPPKTSEKSKSSSVSFSSPTSEVSPESTEVWSPSEPSEIPGEITETITSETSTSSSFGTDVSITEESNQTSTKEFISNEETSESASTSLTAKGKMSKTAKPLNTSGKSKSSSVLSSSPTSAVSSESTQVWSSSSAETSEVAEEMTGTITTETSEEMTNFTRNLEFSSTSSSFGTSISIIEESSQMSTEEFILSEETSESASTSSTAKGKMSKTKKPPKTSEKSKSSTEIGTSSSAGGEENFEVSGRMTETMTTQTSEEMMNSTRSLESTSTSSLIEMTISTSTTEESTGEFTSKEETSEVASTSSSTKEIRPKTKKPEKTSEKSTSSSVPFSSSISEVTPEFTEVRTSFSDESEETSEVTTPQTSEEKTKFTESLESSPTSLLNETVISTSEESSQLPTGEFISNEGTSESAATYFSTKAKTAKTRKSQKTTAKSKSSTVPFSSSTTEVSPESKKISKFFPSLQTISSTPATSIITEEKFGIETSAAAEISTPLEKTTQKRVTTEKTGIEDYETEIETEAGPAEEYDFEEEYGSGQLTDFFEYTEEGVTQPWGTSSSGTVSTQFFETSTQTSRTTSEFVQSSEIVLEVSEAPSTSPKSFLTSSEPPETTSEFFTPAASTSELLQSSGTTQQALTTLKSSSETSKTTFELFTTAGSTAEFSQSSETTQEAVTTLESSLETSKTTSELFTTAGSTPEYSQSSKTTQEALTTLESSSKMSHTTLEFFITSLPTSGFTHSSETTLEALTSPEISLKTSESSSSSFSAPEISTSPLPWETLGSTEQLTSIITEYESTPSVMTLAPKEAITERTTEFITLRDTEGFEFTESFPDFEEGSTTPGFGEKQIMVESTTEFVMNVSMPKFLERPEESAEDYNEEISTPESETIISLASSTETIIPHEFSTESEPPLGTSSKELEASSKFGPGTEIILSSVFPSETSGPLTTPAEFFSSGTTASGFIQETQFTSSLGLLRTSTEEHLAIRPETPMTIISSMQTIPDIPTLSSSEEYETTSSGFLETLVTASHKLSTLFPMFSSASASEITEEKSSHHGKGMTKTPETSMDDEEELENAEQEQLDRRRKLEKKMKELEDREKALLEREAELRRRQEEWEREKLRRQREKERLEEEKRRKMMTTIRTTTTTTEIPTTTIDYEKLKELEEMRRKQAELEDELDQMEKEIADKEKELEEKEKALEEEEKKHEKERREFEDMWNEESELEEKERRLKDKEKKLLEKSSSTPSELLSTSEEDESTAEELSTTEETAAFEQPETSLPRGEGDEETNESSGDYVFDENEEVWKEKPPSDNDRKTTEDYVDGCSSPEPTDAPRSRIAENDEVESDKETGAEESKQLDESSDSVTKKVCLHVLDEAIDPANIDSDKYVTEVMCMPNYKHLRLQRRRARNRNSRRRRLMNVEETSTVPTDLVKVEVEKRSKDVVHDLKIRPIASLDLMHGEWLHNDTTMRLHTPIGFTRVYESWSRVPIEPFTFMEDFTRKGFPVRDETFMRNNFKVNKFDQRIQPTQVNRLANDEWREVPVKGSRGEGTSGPDKEKDQGDQSDNEEDEDQRKRKRRSREDDEDDDSGVPTEFPPEYEENCLLQQHGRSKSERSDLEDDDEDRNDDEQVFVEPEEKAGGDDADEDVVNVEDENDERTIPPPGDQDDSENANSEDESQNHGGTTEVSQNTEEPDGHEKNLSDDSHSEKGLDDTSNGNTNGSKNAEEISGTNSPAVQDGKTSPKFSTTTLEPTSSSYSSKASQKPQTTQSLPKTTAGDYGDIEYVTDDTLEPSDDYPDDDEGMAEDNWQDYTDQPESKGDMKKREGKLRSSLRSLINTKKMLMDKKKSLLRRENMLKQKEKILKQSEAGLEHLKAKRSRRKTRKTRKQVTSWPTEGTGRYHLGGYDKWQSGLLEDIPQEFQKNRQAFTVNVLRLDYDEEEENHKLRCDEPDKNDLIINQGLVTRKIEETTLKRTSGNLESTTKEYKLYYDPNAEAEVVADEKSSDVHVADGELGKRRKESKRTTRSRNPPGTEWPTEMTTVYHVGGTKFWDKERTATPDNGNYRRRNVRGLSYYENDEEGEALEDGDEREEYVDDVGTTCMRLLLRKEDAKVWEEKRSAEEQIQAPEDVEDDYDEDLMPLKPKLRTIKSIIQLAAESPKNVDENDRKVRRSDDMGLQVDSPKLVTPPGHQEATKHEEKYLQPKEPDQDARNLPVLIKVNNTKVIRMANFDRPPKELYVMYRCGPPEIVAVFDPKAEGSNREKFEDSFVTPSTAANHIKNKENYEPKYKTIFPFNRAQISEVTAAPIEAHIHGELNPSANLFKRNSRKKKKRRKGKRKGHKRRRKPRKYWRRRIFSLPDDLLHDNPLNTSEQASRFQTHHEGFGRSLLSLKHSKRRAKVLKHHKKPHPPRKPKPKRQQAKKVHKRETLPSENIPRTPGHFQDTPQLMNKVLRIIKTPNEDLHHKSKSPRSILDKMKQVINNVIGNDSSSIPEPRVNINPDEEEVNDGYTEIVHQSAARFMPTEDVPPTHHHGGRRRHRKKHRHHQEAHSPHHRPHASHHHHQRHHDHKLNHPQKTHSKSHHTSHAHLSRETAHAQPSETKRADVPHVNHKSSRSPVKPKLLSSRKIPVIKHKPSSPKLSITKHKPSSLPNALKPLEIAQNDQKPLNISSIIPTVKNLVENQNLGSLEKIIVYVDKTEGLRKKKRTTDNFPVKMRPEHEKQKRGAKRSKSLNKSNLEEVSFDGESLDEMISHVADKILTSVSGSSLHDLDPHLSVKVIQEVPDGAGEPHEETKSEFSINLLDSNLKKPEKSRKEKKSRSKKTSSSNRLTSGSSRRKMNLRGAPGKKRNLWKSKIKRENIVEEIRKKLEGELRKKLSRTRRRVPVESMEDSEKPLPHHLDDLDEKIRILYAMHHKKEAKGGGDNKKKRGQKNHKRSKREDDWRLDYLESNIFATENDKKSLRGLIEQIINLQKNVNTTLQIIRRQLDESSNIIARNLTRRMIPDSSSSGKIDQQSNKKSKKQNPKKNKGKKKSPKTKPTKKPTPKPEKKAVKPKNKKHQKSKAKSSKKKLEMSYGDEQVDKIGNEIQEILKEEGEGKISNKKKRTNRRKTRTLKAFGGDDSDTLKIGRHLCSKNIHDRQKKSAAKKSKKPKSSRKKKLTRKKKSNAKKSRLASKKSTRKAKLIVGNQNKKIRQAVHENSSRSNHVSDRNASLTTHFRSNRSENCEGCLCDLGNVVSNLRKMLLMRNDLLDRISTYTCQKFVGIGDELILTSSGVLGDVLPRSRRQIAEARGLKYIRPGDLEDLLEGDEVRGHEHEILSFPGSDLNIPCNHEGEEITWVMSISRPNYTWTRVDSSPISGTIRKNGNLELYDVDAKDAGNYSCIVTYVDPDNEELVENIYQHSIQIVTLPRYSLRGGNRYKMDICEDPELDILSVYLPSKLNEVLCKNSICDAFIFAPHCHSHQFIPMWLEMSQSCAGQTRFSTDPESTNYSKKNELPNRAQDRLVPIENRFVDFGGGRGRRAYERTKRRDRGDADGEVGLLVGCPAGYGLDNSHCVPCSPHYHSQDLSARCKRCPLGTHQPSTGSRVCKSCTNPFVDGCYDMLWTTSSVLLAVLASLLAVILVCLIVLWTICCGKPRKPEDSLKQETGDSIKQPLIPPLDSQSDLEELIWERPRKKKKKKLMKRFLKAKEEEQPLVYGINLLPRKKNERERERVKTIPVCCIDSYRSHGGHCPECKHPYVTNHGTRRAHGRPPVPFPDFDR